MRHCFLVLPSFVLPSQPALTQRSRNYPIHNAISPIIAALFAGNTVVLKCSEQVLWSTRWLVDAVRACLKACDMDPEAVQVGSVILLYTLRLMMASCESARMLLSRGRTDDHHASLDPAHHLSVNSYRRVWLMLIVIIQSLAVKPLDAR